jgi:hypothetical protein
MTAKALVTQLALVIAIDDTNLTALDARKPTCITFFAGPVYVAGLSHPHSFPSEI